MNNNNNLYTTNFDKFITMKKVGMGSLKLELDSLKDLDDNTGFYKNSLTTDIITILLEINLELKINH